MQLETLRWRSKPCIFGETRITGTILKVEELASVLQVCLDAGAKKVLIPITSAAEIGAVPSDLISEALGVE